MNEGRSGIYAITNTKSGKVYIGSTIDFEKRWGEHRRALRRGDHGNTYLQRSYAKYGADVFKFSILGHIDSIENLTEAEQFWMDKYREEGRELYNCGLAADSPRRGQHHTEETKRKLSILTSNQCPHPALGNKHSEETKRKIGNSNRGKIRTDEHKQKLREANLGKKHFEGTKRKISKSNRGKHYKKFSKETKRRMSESAKRRAPDTEETRRNKSKAMKMVWARRKGEKAHVRDNG